MSSLLVRGRVRRGAGGAGFSRAETGKPPARKRRHSQSLALADCPRVPPPSATLTPPPHCGEESIASPCSALAACRRRCRKAVSALRRLDICGGAANIVRSSDVVSVGRACGLGYVVRRPKRLRRRGSAPNPRKGSAPYSIEFTRLSTSSQALFEEKGLTRKPF